MSSEWPLVAIGDVAQLFDGPHATPKKTDSGPVFLGISSLKRGQLDLSNTEHLSEDDFKKWTKRVVPQAEDIVFSYETRIGEVAAIPEGLRCCLGRRMALLRPDRSRLLPNYLLYYFLSDEFQSLLKTRTIHGSTVDRLPLTEFPSYPVRIPPLVVQSSISKTLQILDDRITLLRETNATLEAIAQALFKSWFVDFDPVRAKMEGRVPEGMDEATAALFPDALVTSELGLVPEGWRAASVYAIAKVTYGAPFASKLFKSEPPGKPLVRIRDLKDERPGVYTEEVHPKGYLLRPGDITVGMDGEFRAYVWGGEQAWLNQRVCVFHPINGACSAFVRFSIAPLLAAVEASETATTVIHLGKNDIDRFKVITPSPEILSAFAEVANPLYERLVTNKQQAQTLATLRDTLLPRLISGQLRLPEAQAAAEGAMA